MGDLVATLRAKRFLSPLISAFVVVLLVGYVINQSWSGRELTSDSLVFFLVGGVTLGSIYAVAASGLVVTYTTSGVFNFAQGAIGMFMAFVYWELKVNHELPTWLAFGLTVFVLAPLFGALIERILMRRLATAPLVAQLVVTIGLLFALIGLANFIWDPSDTRTIGTFFPGEGFDIGETFIPWYRAITIFTGIAMAVGFWVLLNYTRIGVAMRAVVDNRELAALNGVHAGRISMFAWSLGSGMAAIAGIFLAEELSTLATDPLTLLIVDAFAAAIIGRLRSLPLTFLGGMIIGLALSLKDNFLDWGGRFTSAREAIPTLILFLALLFLPQARIEGRRAADAVAPRIPTVKRALFGFGVVMAAIVLLAAVFDQVNGRRLSLGVITAFVLLSLVPLTGWSGQISLAQITFAGVGAWWMTEIGSKGNPAGLLVGALVAIPFGVLMAVPALRLRGLYLALASMAFARMAEIVIFEQPEVFGGASPNIGDLKIFGVNVHDSFEVLGIEFAPDSGILILATGLFCVVGFFVVLIRRGSFGRRLVAMRDSPAACATLGVNLTLTKLGVFALSASIAGFAGALLGVLRGGATTDQYRMLPGLPYLLLLVVGGASLVSGALTGGILLQSFAWLTNLFPGSRIVSLWSRIGPGLAGIGIGREPEGLVVAIGAGVRGEAKQKRPSGKEPPRGEAEGEADGEVSLAPPEAERPTAPAPTPTAGA